MSLGETIPKGSTVKVLRAGIGGAHYMKGEGTDDLKIGDLVNYYTGAIDKFTKIPKEDCIGLVVSAVPEPFVEPLRKLARKKLQEMQNAT